MKMKILQTKEYGKFTTITGNRNINRNKVEKLVEDVKSGFNMLAFCPIIVKEIDDMFHIIDGQHRYETSIACEEPVYYLIKNDFTLQQIAKLNSRGQKWSMNDFLNCYCKLGIEDYSILKNTTAQYKVMLGTVASLLMLNDVRKRVKDDFEQGTFKVNHLEETQKLLELTEDVFGRYSFSRDRLLIGAVQAIANAGKCDFEVLKDKIKQNPMGMDKQGDIKNYIYNIERVYNFKNRERQTIV